MYLSAEHLKKYQCDNTFSANERISLITQIIGDHFFPRRVSKRQVSFTPWDELGNPIIFT